MILTLCRLKKVQGKKKRDNAARELEAQEMETSVVDQVLDEGGPADLLSSKDEDIIF